MDQVQLVYLFFNIVLSNNHIVPYAPYVLYRIRSVNNVTFQLPRNLEWGQIVLEDQPSFHWGANCKESLEQMEKIFL